MIFSGVTILQGVEFPIFPIDFAWALQQCSATALPVILILCREISALLYNYISCEQELLVLTQRIYEYGMLWNMVSFKLFFMILPRSICWRLVMVLIEWQKPYHASYCILHIDFVKIWVVGIDHLLCFVLRWFVEVCHHNSERISCAWSWYAGDSLTDAVQLWTVIKVSVQAHFSNRSSAAAVEYSQNSCAVFSCNSCCVDCCSLFDASYRCATHCSTATRNQTARRNYVSKHSVEDHCWLSGYAAEPEYTDRTARWRRGNGW